MKRVLFVFFVVFSTNCSDGPTQYNADGGTGSAGNGGEDTESDNPAGITFSKPCGTFVDVFELNLQAKESDAEVYYTLDGTAPSETKGEDTLFSGSINISKTTWVRARVFEPGGAAGPITSCVYIALEKGLAGYESNLPLVVIDSFGFDVDKEWDPESGRPYRPVSAVFIDSGSVRAGILDAPDYAGHGGIHVRGSSTAEYDKKQYRFETWDENDQDAEHSLLGFPEESDWILHAPYSDKTLMRNYLMYSWSNAIGRYAVRTRFVEVFIDDTGERVEASDYRGVYVFMEKIKRDKDRVDVEKLPPEVDSAPNISGGYILKKDWWEGMEEEEEEEGEEEWKGGGRTPRKGGGRTPREGEGEYAVGFVTQTYKDALLYVYPKPENITDAQKQWVESHFNEFESAISGTNYADPTDGYHKYIDVGSFIDHHILVEMAKNVDGFVLSTFLFKDHGGKINMGPIWDYNGSLGGADYFCNYDPTGWLHEVFNGSCTDPCEEGEEEPWEEEDEEGSWPFDNPTAYEWYKRLFQDEAFRKQYASRWSELRNGIFTTENMLADINESVSLLTDNGAADNAMTRNFTRWNIHEELWPNHYDNCHPDAEYEEYVNRLRSWLTERLQWMDTAIAEQYAK